MLRVNVGLVVIFNYTHLLKFSGQTRLRYTSTYQNVRNITTLLESKITLFTKTIHFHLQQTDGLPCRLRSAFYG